MKKFGDRKVLVHCQANLRASSMTFPYRVIVDHESPETAYEPVTQVWLPEGSWKRLITTMEKNVLQTVKFFLVIGLFFSGLTACATHNLDTSWTRLIQGEQGLENFSQVGEANWGATDDTIQATEKSKAFGFLVSKNAYQDFMIHVEFWASEDANSGIFLRCQNPNNITDENCYEVNIFDQRPDPAYATGGIVKVAKAPNPVPKAGGKWNTYEISARGSRLGVVLNGIQTVDIEDTRLVSGPIALQWARGTIKFRKVDIRPLQ